MSHLVDMSTEDLPICENCLKQGKAVSMVKTGHKCTVGWRGHYECPECDFYGASTVMMDDPYYRIASEIIDDLAARGLDQDDIRRVVDKALWLSERQHVIQARRSAEEDLRRDAISRLEELRAATIRANNKRSEDEFVASILGTAGGEQR
jgi:hypothetical protein